jgi:hypothetical protein
LQVVSKFSRTSGHDSQQAFFKRIEECQRRERLANRLGAIVTSIEEQYERVIRFHRAGKDLVDLPSAPRQSFLFVATIIFVSCRQVYRPID